MDSGSGSATSLASKTCSKSIKEVIWPNSENLDFDMITIAPNYSLTDSLGVILEYNDIDQGTIDQNQLAVELTYTF